MIRLITAAFAVACFLVAAPGYAARPSILLLTIDTIRGDALPVLGNPRSTAPFLDSLATVSTRFTNAHSTSSWTVPAITSLLTGLYPASHGVVHGAVSRGDVYDQEIVPGSLPLLAEELQKLGYKTYGVTANAHLSPDLGYGRGFDRYLCIGVEPAENVNATLLKWKANIEAETAPVFIWVHYYDPHHTYTQREPYFREFAGAITSGDSRLMTLAGKSPPVPPRKVSEQERFIHLARSLHDSEIRYMDDFIAKLFRDLPGLNEYMTIVAGDHGEEFLDHGDVMHCRNLHRETVRIPLFVKGPGLTPGDCAAPVSLVDVPATLLSFAGGAIPSGWAGKSLVATAKNPGATADRMLTAALERNRESGVHTALITSGWKFIRTDRGNHLYDLTKDPGELKNLAATDPDRVLEMNRTLDAFLKSLPAPPAIVERKKLSKEAEVQLKGQGYIH